MAYQVNLSSKEQKELMKRKQEEKNVKIYRRLECIQLKVLGTPNKDIAPFLGVTIETLSHWLKAFDEGGFDQLCHLDYEGRRTSKLDVCKKDIRAYVKQETPSKLAELQGWIKRQYGITVELSWLSRYCKKNSIFLTKKRD